MSYAFDPVAIRERRNRLRNPPNAVPDYGIQMRNGWPVDPPKPAPAPKPAPVDAAPSDPVRRPLRIWPIVDDADLQAEIEQEAAKRVRIVLIQRIVARYYGISFADLLSWRRTANVVRPRQVAMYLAKTLTLRSLPAISRGFGGRDHTTVLHAVRKTEARIAADEGVAREVEQIRQEILECCTGWGAPRAGGAIRTDESI